MVVVTDASPVIFLAKISRLDLFRGVLGKDIHVPKLVRDEILSSPLTPSEERSLEQFLAKCTVESVRRPQAYSKGLSEADNAALTLALRRKPATLVSDDRLVRKVAQLEGIYCIGTLGLIVGGCKRGQLSSVDAKQLIDDLIDKHSFRIGIELYRQVTSIVDALSNP